ncbi:MAG: ATP-binding protein [Lentimicrobium sp.]|jgi:PAS domain S-box-containing protein|nr:ATP-binding protein [Lentimicrobium sp.]
MYSNEGNSKSQRDFFEAEGNENLGNFLRSMPLPVFIADADFGLVWMNDSAEIFCDKKGSNYTSKPLTELFKPVEGSFQLIRNQLHDSGNLKHYIDVSIAMGNKQAVALVYTSVLNDTDYYIFQIKETSVSSDTLVLNNEISGVDIHLLKLIGNALPYPFYVIDVHNYKTLVKNAAALEMEDRILSTQCFTHSDSYECNINAQNCIIKLVLEAKSAVKAEHVYQLKGGNDCYCEVHGYPVFGIGGAIDFIIYNAIDITEQRINEALIAANQNTLNDLLSNFPGLVYLCVRKDTEWELQYISPGCRQIIGYSANNLIAKRSLHFDLFIYHEDKAHVLSEITQAVRRNRKYRIEYRVIAHNGKIKWVSEYGRGEMNEENELVKLEGFVTDITKVKNYDFKLQHELKINQSLAEMGVELLGETIDVDSIVCKVQENVMQYTQSTFSVLIVPSMDDDGMIYYLKNKSASKEDRFNRVLLNEKNSFLLNSLESENELLYNDKPFTIRLDALGMKDVKFERMAGAPVLINNEQRGYLLVAGAPSDYTRSTIDLVNRFLNIFVLGLFRIRTEKSLQLSKSIAEESDRLKSMFLSNMSHEIRTPMNAIVGFADMLHDSSLKREEKDSFLDAISRSGDSLLLLINDIIDISKIEAGQLKLMSTTFNLNELLDEIHVDFSRELERKHKSSVILYVNKEYSGVDFIIQTDAMRLRQVLSNLVGNAIKFTDEGFIEIGYRLDSGKLLLYVRDSGSGISKEDQALIFERFGQGKSQMEKNSSGTGLGLTISKNLIELMGGNIWVDSMEGEGSTFWFSLPLLKIAGRSNHSNEDKVVVPSINLADKTILVVEDVDTNYFYISTLLEKLNAKVIRAVNGVKAVDICESKQNIDLVLMDIDLPLMNGYEATKVIKQKRPDLPIIAQTAFAMSGERERSLEAGCDDYLAKPIRKDDLISTISRLL